MKDILMTIERHIIEEQRLYGGTGDFSSVLTQIVLAAKVVSAQVSQAGLAENILGSAGAKNITGDEQQKLDVFADRAFINALSYIGKVCVMASEEDDDVVLVPDGYPKGEYVVMIDILDGSSNILVYKEEGNRLPIRSGTGRRLITERYIQITFCLSQLPPRVKGFRPCIPFWSGVHSQFPKREVGHDRCQKIQS